MRKAISYIRVSSEEQADSGLGLEAQRRRIAAYCEMKGLRLVEVFEDPGVSGGKPLADCPAGRRLLAAARKTKAVVVVAKLDRLFRSVADAANVIADFDKRGIELPKNGLHCTCEFYTHPQAYSRQMACIAPASFTHSPTGWRGQITAANRGTRTPAISACADLEQSAPMPAFLAQR